MREFSGGLLLEDLEIVLCAYVKGAYTGGMRWRERCSSFLFIMTNFVYSIKIYKFTVRNNYHCGHHAMQISVRTPPYNFVMLYICGNSKIIFWPHFIQRNVVCEINMKRGLFRSMGYVM